MNDQPNSQATNANPDTEQQSKVLNEEDWIVQKCPDPGRREVLGFLQLCADRRFHRCIQERFQTDTKLKPEDYWIHADAGGTPKMASLVVAPNYCYGKGVRWMAWSAHGDKCGGFGEDVPDDVIVKALRETAESKIQTYPGPKHFVYFATLKKVRDTEETVLYSMASD